jgi:hypothetical protein
LIIPKTNKHRTSEDSTRPHFLGDFDLAEEATAGRPILMCHGNPTGASSTGT